MFVVWKQCASLNNVNIGEFHDIKLWVLILICWHHNHNCCQDCNIYTHQNTVCEKETEHSISKCFRGEQPMPQ